MSNDKPTDRAREHFGFASQKASEAERHFSTLKFDKTINKVVDADDRQRGEIALANAVYYLAWGLRDLSTGLRATYVLLDEVNKKLPK
jgi:hypothetical protein